MLKVNREKAEELTMGRIRRERALRLADLDVQFMRAIEQNQDTTEIVAEKQALRDITEKDLNALTLEKLSTLTLHEVLAL